MTNTLQLPYIWPPSARKAHPHHLHILVPCVGLLGRYDLLRMPSAFYRKPRSTVAHPGFNKMNWNSMTLWNHISTRRQNSSVLLACCNLICLGWLGKLQITKELAVHMTPVCIQSEVFKMCVYCNSVVEVIWWVIGASALVANCNRHMRNELQRYNISIY